jgi:hypothetical protein
MSDKTRDLYNALVNNDYPTAKESLQGKIKEIIKDKIDVKKQEFRDQISTDAEE